MKIFFLILFSVLSLSCSSSKPSASGFHKKEIMNAYVSQIARYDGINPQEALTLAQSEMIFRGRDSQYHLDKPKFEAVDQEHWGIRFYPINKTSQDVIRNPSVLVIINKQDGKITWNDQGTSYMFMK